MKASFPVKLQAQLSLQSTPPKHGKAAQDLPPKDNSPTIDKKRKKCVQQVIGTYLYYGCAVDKTILCSLSEIAGQQGSPIEKSMKQVDQFLNYMATHPEAFTIMQVT